MSDLERKFAALKEKQCTTKKRYNSEAEAQDAAGAANVPFVSETISAYKCPWCTGWHIGKSR